MLNVTKELTALARKLGYTGKAPDTVAKAINAITSVAGNGGDSGGANVITLTKERYDSAKHDELIGQEGLDYINNGDLHVSSVLVGATAEEIYENSSRVEILSTEEVDEDTFLYKFNLPNITKIETSSGFVFEIQADTDGVFIAQGNYCFFEAIEK